MGQHVTIRIDRTLAAMFSKDLKEANYPTPTIKVLSAAIDHAMKDKSAAVTITPESSHGLVPDLFD